MYTAYFATSFGLKSQVHTPTISHFIMIRSLWGVQNSWGNLGCGTYTTAMLSTFDVPWQVISTSDQGIIIQFAFNVYGPYGEIPGVQ